MDIEKLKFPIGEFQKPSEITSTHINRWLEDISSFPKRLEETVLNLSNGQLNWKYRPQGWNIKQVVHHCADSHMNAFIRFKLTLTEDSPQIKPYMEALWADMKDVLDQDISDSLNILKGVHSRWSRVIQEMSSDDLRREYIHPEFGRRYPLDEGIGLYAWHCNHHLAHINQALEGQGKYN